MKFPTPPPAPRLVTLGTATITAFLVWVSIDIIGGVAEGTTNPALLIPSISGAAAGIILTTGFIAHLTKGVDQ